jgi:DNA-binding response OmpR family regulator
VLVVEDDAVLSDLLREVFDDEGYEVRVASDGRDALSVLATWRPDVIILDLMMSPLGGDGLRAVQRREGYHGDVPVVLVSARQDVFDQVARLGASAAFLKPFDLTELLVAVGRLAPRPD